MYARPMRTVKWLLFLHVLSGLHQKWAVFRVALPLINKPWVIKRGGGGIPPLPESPPAPLELSSQVFNPLPANDAYMRHELP